MAELNEQEKQWKVNHSLLVGTFETELGRKYLDLLDKTFVDRSIYVSGLSIEQTAYRQGQADLVKQIQKELNNGRYRSRWANKQSYS